MLFRKIARQVTTAPDGFAAGPVPARHRAQLKGRQRLLDRLGVLLPHFPTDLRAG